MAWSGTILENSKQKALLAFAGEEGLSSKCQSNLRRGGLRHGVRFSGRHGFRQLLELLHAIQPFNQLYPA